MRFIVGCFRVLFTPSVWLQNYRYSREWDKVLRRLLETEHFTDIGNYRAMIGNRSVWVENHPYASFTLGEGAMQCRPRRITLLRAWDRLMADHPALQELRETDELEKLAALTAPTSPGERK